MFGKSIFDLHLRKWHDLSYKIIDGNWVIRRFISKFQLKYELLT